MSTSDTSDEDFRKIYRRNRSLSKIMLETRQGEVDGISFDLRHDELDPREWEMDILGAYDFDGPRRIGTLPFLWFPWHGTFDAKKLEAEVKEECKSINSYNRNPYSTPREALGKISDAEYEVYIESRKNCKLAGKTWIKQEIAERTPDAIVTYGDRISIDRCIRYYGDDLFDHEHDNQEIHVFLKITNNSGKVRTVKNPVKMFGSTRITYRHGNIPLFAILARLKKYYNIDKFEEDTFRRISDEKPNGGAAYDALYHAAHIYRLYLPKIERLRNSEFEGISDVGDKYVRALDNACMLGYAWARAEHEMKLRPLVDLGQKIVLRARIGGKRSGESRLKEANEMWKPHALGLAQAGRSEKPSLSTEKLADYIRDKWRLSINRPAHSTLRNFIADMESEGKLARKTGKT